MKLRKLVTTLLIGFLSLTFVSTVNAAESTANITFTPGDGAPPVLDPTDPDEEYEPDPEDETDPQDEPTNETGPLTLDYVSSIYFDEQPILARTETYESTTLRPFIQVSDRRGTGEGWNVTAQLGEFSAGEESDSLPGAVLTFSNGEVLSTSLSTEPNPNEQVVLNAGGAVSPVVDALVDTGLGSWLTRWFPSDESELNDNVTLEVPAGGATAGENTATITWTLEAGPSN